ncbi:hypothetical protein [Tunturiibacter gelidiferens]|uniref:hypothetical protein n=1 Tax=Tunturiibacter gelidiferens TaxID=3069689 RepID=UPI003D9AFDFA
MLILRIVCGVMSGLLFYIGLNVYEDESKNLKSRLEVWWIKLSDFELLSRRKELRVVDRFAVICSSLLDWVFGKKLISLRSIGASMLVSVGTSILFLWSLALFVGETVVREF